MKFLVGNQLPATLARRLTYEGCEPVHVLDIGLQASDKEILNYAGENGCVVVSKFEDFFHVISTARVDVQLVCVRIGNCRKAASVVRHAPGPVRCDRVRGSWTGLVENQPLAGAAEIDLGELRLIGGHIG